jgi:hypothetical protein
VAAVSGIADPNGGVSAVVLDASIVLDNGVSGELLRRRHDSGGGGKCKLEVCCEESGQAGAQESCAPTRTKSKSLAPQKRPERKWRASLGMTVG